MNTYRIALLVMGTFLFASMHAACGSTEGGDGDYACSYETRTTDGCDGYGFGEWEEECFSFNADDYVISPEEVCDNVTTGGVYCEAGCCIDSEFRNVSLDPGFCS